ncbi:phospholipase A2 inhibitor NAI-like [Elgaria multicarinata webbii]|uniref:phospholipase A2 inhibitor NAI-like n=1 Tax=Elgaria multicarinata webbii TaxID=159646 RepID=UPI002FCCE548
MQNLLGLFICFVLVNTGTALECEVCIGIGTDCTGSMQTCEAGKDTCVIAVTENTMSGLPILTVVKACESSNTCNLGPQYMHFGQRLNMRTGITCCVGDACRTVTPQLPPVITESNGKQCPACYNVISGNCNQDETVDCFGPESECLDLSATVTHGTVVVNTVQKGCVTRGVCDGLTVAESKMAGIRTLITRAECRAATNLA